MAALVDTNVLVYRYDSRFPEKQRAAFGLLRWGAEEGSLVVPHQAIVEFVAAATRPLWRGGRSGPDSRRGAPRGRGDPPHLSRPLPHR